MAVTTADRLRRAQRLAGSAPVAVVLLVGANLIPLVGVLWLGWNWVSVLVMYWLENGVVGVLNALRMAFAGAPDQLAAKVTTIPFFVFHYGVFWLGHGVFVFALPALVGDPSVGFPEPAVVAVGGTALALSHAASFYLNYLRSGEYRTATARGLVMTPYNRVMVLHVTILVGSFLALKAGGPIAFIALLVVLKTAFDLGLHLREHAAARRATA